ncbi:MAG: Polysaccharide deacetylase [Nitrososphaeraceae archaeon]|nr:Polysaccharide deacetylase [Nitrososphaeraceae archaeon]
MSKIIGSFGPLVSSIIIFMGAFITIMIGFSLPITTFGQLEIQQRESTSNKVVILTFGNAPKSQYTEAKPILDKYGFKASFFVVCNWINSDKDNSHMTWQDIETLYNDGHNIGAKSLNHKDLTTLSASELDFEVGQSKKCLDDQNIDARVFGTPYGKGWDNPTVIDTIAKYYDFAITGFSKLMYLNCDGWNQQEEEENGYKSNTQTDCRTYSDAGTLTYANRYSIKEWSHSNADKEYFGNDQLIFEEFVKAVNSQENFNGDGIIRAIPIIAYHDLDHNITPDSTSVNLFDAEMKYLYDNGFTVLTMADLGYDESTHQLYIRYIGPSTINHIGPTMQTEAVSDDDDDAEEDDMGLELEDNDADIGFDNGEQEEDSEGNNNELSESNTQEEDDDDDDGSGA